MFSEIRNHKKEINLMGNIIRKSKEDLLKEAHGNLIGLLIGIDNYEKSSGFGKLKTCVNDVVTLKTTLTNTPQLNVDGSRLMTVTEKLLFPSRGNIIKKIKDVCELAEKEDRLFVYYSGHGHRLLDENGEDEFYLVPQDVYDAEDRNSLIAFSEIVSWVENSLAKQKIIFLDACLSGPNITDKKLSAAKYSPKFLAQYLEKTKGIVIISSSSSNEFSHSKSPNKDISLFTYYLLKALEGEPKALDNTNILTIESLYDYVSTEVQRRAKSYQSKQTPNCNIKATGVIVLGDFSKVLLPNNGADFSELPIKGISFEDSRERVDAKDILTKIQRWSAYTEDYIEEKVNDNLGEYLENEFGEIKAKILNVFDFTINSVSYDDNSLVFPSGTYKVTYFAEEKKRGKLNRTVYLDVTWFEDVGDIITLLDALNMFPQGMIFELKKTIKPSNSLQALKAKGWELKSMKNEELLMKMEQYTLTINSDSITFKGIVPSDIFGGGFDKQKLATTYQTISLLAS